MTRLHALTLAALFLGTVASGFVTGELMDAPTLNGLGIAAGTLATCGCFAAFGKLLERTAL